MEETAAYTSIFSGVKCKEAKSKATEREVELKYGVLHSVQFYLHSRIRHPNL